MSKDRKKKGLLRRGVCCVSVLAMASLMVVPVASAADGDTNIKWTAPNKEKSIEGNVTVGAHRQGEAIGEIVGVNLTSVSSQTGFVTINGTLADAENDAKLGIYGSSANSNADPFIWNYFYNFYAKEIGYSTTDNVFRFGTVNARPTQANTNIESEYGTSSDLAWRPDIVIANDGSKSADVNDEQGLSEAGTWGGLSDLILEMRAWTNDPNGGIPTDVPESEKSEYTENADGTWTNPDGNVLVYSTYYRNGDYKYNPKAFAYPNDNSFNNLIQVLYSVAEQANTVKAADGKTTRYADPMYSAYKYEQFANGLKWQVYKGIEEDLIADGNENPSMEDIAAARKTVAFITDSSLSGKSQATLQELQKDADNTEVYGNQVGYYSAIEGTVKDLGWDLTDTDSSGNKLATAEDLKSADVIFTKDVETVEQWVGDDYAGVIYNQGLPTGTYGLEIMTIESVELVGFSQGLIYPEYVDPVNTMLYFYDEFYHLTSDSWQDALTLNCTGVNLPDKFTWTTTSYDHDAIQADLNADTEWFFNNKDAFSNLRPVVKASEQLTTAYNAGTLDTDAFKADANAAVPEDANPTADADDLQEQLDAALDQLEQAKSELDDLQAQIDELEGANQELQDAYDQIQAQIDDINAQLDQLDRDLQNALEQASNAKDNAEAAEEALESAQQQLTADETQISDLQKQNEELQKQASQAGSGKSGSSLKSQTIKTTTYKSFKAKKIKKKKQSFNVAKASGKITVKKGKGSKKLKVAKNGKITAKKGLKKGTYTVQVTINAAATSTYAAASTSATITVEVK